MLPHGLFYNGGFMKFIANNAGVGLVELDQINEDEVAILLDGQRVAYFDADENEFVVFNDRIVKAGLTVSVEDSPDGLTE